MPVEQEVMAIYAGTKGYLDDVPINRVQEFQSAFLKFVQASAPQLAQGLATKKELTEELESQLKKALDEFKAHGWSK
jgi:F-type H+-transporting ATPase subunit alpha